MDPNLSSPGMRRDGVILPIVKKGKKKRVTHAIISRDNLARLGHGQVMRRWDFLVQDMARLVFCFKFRPWHVWSAHLLGVHGLRSS